MKLFKQQESLVLRSLELLPSGDRRKMYLVVFAQTILGVLDLFGVLLVGLLGTVAVTGLGGPAADSKINKLLGILKLTHLTLQQKVMVIGILATTFLVLKSLISIYLTKRITFFLSRRGALISRDLINRMLSLPLEQVQQRSIHENIYSLTQGVATIILGVVGSLSNALADLILLIIIFVGLLAIDPSIAVLSFAIFGFFGFVLHQVMSVRSQKLGKLNTTLSIRSNQLINEALTGFREMVTRGKRDYYASKIGDERLQLSSVTAEIAFLPNFSKYLIEATVVLGTVLVSAIQFSLVGATQAVGVLVLFLAAAMRIAPAVLRVQQGLLGVRTNLGSVTTTLDLIKTLNELPIPTPISKVVDFDHSGFKASINAEHVYHRYLNSHKDSVHDISLLISPGTKVAFVGNSGSGKTTLVDLLIGVAQPYKGNILISGVSPSEAISKWPGAIGYVPQAVNIINGTLLENVTLGYSVDEFTVDRAVAALTNAGLEEFILDNPNGLETQVGENGFQLSGGQKQRLGIARALFTSPKILVLDESTSALDGKSEKLISESISRMSNDVTILAVAHRLSTIRDFDQIVLIEEGRIIGIDGFEGLKNRFPSFRTQADHLGL